MGLREVSWGFTEPPLLENVTLQVEKGQKIGVLGRNGVGKSTLLRLLSGNLLPDKGEVWRQQGLRVAAMEQEVPADFSGSVLDAVMRGNETTSRWQAERVLSHVGIDPSLYFTDLSAGMKRQTLFCRAMAGEPEVLLLDEPTNHLDIGTILWMEEYIDRNVKTLIFITHDRAFLKRVANRIVEIDRGHLISYDTDYQSYLEKREALLDAEAHRDRVFDKKLSQEEAWIRQGIKARRTRNEGRVRALEALREVRNARRRQIQNPHLMLQEAERSGKLVIEAKSITHHYDNTAIIKEFSTVVLRGDKVGIIGPNGAGKTTLLKLLLKEIQPDTGSVRHGTHLQTAYFDQLRAGLDEEKSVRDNIAEGNDFITYNGEKRHVIGYLQDFLFSPERCRTPVKVLSGGEKNRLMLAKLFTRPANVLVMDEPTNDLDTETLDLLEQVLSAYPGTLLMVSHDRAFLNSVVTSTIVFEGDGRVVEYAGGYDDWLLQRPSAKTPDMPKPQNPPKEKTPAAKEKPRKLGYKEKRELETLPQQIEILETERERLFSELSNPLFYRKEKDEIQRIRGRLEAVEREIATGYARWERLEVMAQE